jgi:tetrahydromethanopterin S-methyltransferase subunit H
MYRFATEQKIFQIGNVKVGGQPGELPTVLIGSIFYDGHKIVQDSKKGIFNVQKSEEIIKRLEALRDLTSNPFVLDIVGNTDEAFRKYIDFVAKVTDAPFQLDSISLTARINAAKYVAEVGLQDRAIYNSVFKGTPEKEIAAILESKIKAAIVLDYNPQDNSVNGKLEALEKALLVVQKAGIEKPLIDTAIPAYGAKMGSAMRVVPLIKEKYGYPVGVGTGNITTTCGWAKANFPTHVRRACDASMNAVMLMLGANWLMYGPVELAEYIYPAIAVTDTMVLNVTAELGTKPLEEGRHPIFRTVEKK